MTTLARFTDWRPGFRKVAFTRLLMAQAHMPFPIAKRTTDDLLDRKPAEIPMPSAERADALVRDAVELGAVGEVGQPRVHERRRAVYA